MSPHPRRSSPSGRRQPYAGGRAAAWLGLAVALSLASAAIPRSASADLQTPQYRLGETTLRDCEGRDPADPINVAFTGFSASWQNSQRLIGYDFDGPELKWRTTKKAAGGSQYIKNGAACTRMNAQSSRGTGVRPEPDLSDTKRHTRFFEQILPLVANQDGSDAILLTVQDAHRDVKSAKCRGPGSFGPVNDRVPLKINGRTDGGYNDAQRLFLSAFRDRRTMTRRGPGRLRFVQCADEEPPRRYSVPWNGLVEFFELNIDIGCQGDWSKRFSPDLGKCRSEQGRVGTPRP